MLSGSIFKKRKTALGTAVIIALAVCLIYGKLLSPKKQFAVFNYSALLVSSSSMEPQYPVRTFVVLKNEPFGNLRAGDVIAFKSDALGGGLALHRITRLTENGLYTKGDANDYEDNQLITEKSYVGKSVFQNYFLGRYLWIIRTPAGFTAFFGLPLTGFWIFHETLRLLKNHNNYEKQMSVS